MILRFRCWILGHIMVGRKQKLLDKKHILTEYYLSPFCSRCGKILDKK